MTKQKWTSGKWEVFGGRLIRSICGAAAVPIAKTESPFRLGVGPARAYTEEQANFTLLAAAPELAKALAAFVRIYDRKMSSGVRGTTVQSDPPEIEAARVALERCGWKW